MSAVADVLDTTGELLAALDNGAELERAADEEEEMAAVHVPKRRHCGGHLEREGPSGASTRRESAAKSGALGDRRTW